MRKISLMILAGLLLVLAVGCGPATIPGDAVVKVVFFWSENCPHCHKVMEDDLPPLVEKYGDQLEILMIEASGADAYEVYLAAIDLYDVPPQRQGVPALYIGNDHLVGSAEIPTELPGLIERYLKQGGVDFPPIPGLSAYVNEQIPAGESQESGAGAKPINLLYFYQTGCQDCDRVKQDLDYLQSKYPQLVVESRNVREDATLAEWMGERAGVPPMRRMTAPTVFVDGDYLLEEDLDARSVEQLLIKYSETGAAAVWQDWQEEAGQQAQQSIAQRFQSFGIFTIVFAGLVDGLNPCAFATMVFFVSYLTISGRKGREVLFVGGAFTLGVFLAYMLVGLGFYNVLGLLGGLLTRLGRWLYGLTAAFCLVLAVFSFADYLKARRGDIGDMSLNLPHQLRMRINALIRKGRKSRAFVAGAFVTGILVSLLELACTGQVYLPTIIFVMSVPELQVRAFLLLLFYNLLFILPLIVVFVLAYYGTGAQKFSQFLQQRASMVKLGMSFLFLVLGGWLAVSLL
jgi:cytochrome c biogenesis protein CcdA/thiol-disulfide isomerase/thioredoxin